MDQKDTKQFVSSTIFNNDDYEQIERDGRIIYRKKVPIEINKYTQSNYINEDDGSPTVRRYEPSPPRKDNTYAYQPTQSTATRREPVTYGGTYGRVMGGSTSTSTKGNLEIITVPYNKPEEHLGEMIESSHKKKAA